MKVMTPAEEFAIDQWLSEYPTELSYDEIIDHIRGDFNNPEILVWGILMGCSQEQIVETIEDTKTAFEDAVNKYYIPINLS